MTTINLNISDDLASKLQALTSNTESYIISLLEQNINKSNHINKILITEYQLAKIENKNIQNDFINVDLENWENEY
jgi:predicted transcriptional regulator